MPVRALVCALTLALAATASAAVGLDGLGPWTHQTNLYPVVRSPWLTYDDFVVKYYHALPQTPSQRCAGAFLDPIECRAASDPAVTDAGYVDAGVAIEAHRFRLGNTVPVTRIKTEFDGVPRDFIDTDLMVVLKDPRTVVVPSRIVVSQCGASSQPVHSRITSSKKIIRYVKPRQCRAMAAKPCPSPPIMDTIREKTIIYIQLLVPADPVTVKTCLLHLSGAIQSASGRTIPDLVFRRHSSNFPPPKTIP
jgi:hypothetical protein